MDNHIIKQILDRHLKHDLDLQKKINDEIREVSRVITQMESLQKEQEKLIREYDSRIALLRQKIADVQSQCSHVVTTFWPDASGGSDSLRKCDLCGKEL